MMSLNKQVCVYVDISMKHTSCMLQTLAPPVFLVPKFHARIRAFDIIMLRLSTKTSK